MSGADALEPLEAGYEAWKQEHPELASEESDEDEAEDALYEGIDPAEVERLKLIEAEDYKVFLELEAAEKRAYNGFIS